MAFKDFCTKLAAPLKRIRDKVCKKNKGESRDNEESGVSNPSQQWIVPRTIGSPVTFVSVPKIIRHQHTICSNCKNVINYDAWNVCESNNQPPVPFKREGPCNHCYKGKQGEERLKCSIIRCEVCIKVGGRNYVEGERDRALIEKGFSKIDKWHFVKQNPDGSQSEAPWELIRFGMCTDVAKARIMGAYASS